jgi:sugar-specific transcriptional regulator TrmB
MMANAGLQRLMQYGLTEYEGRTYLALLAAGPATARDLANVSRVPRTKIYGVLDELHAKGLVQLLPERPKRYEAVPVDKYLAQFEAEIQKKLDALRADREQMAREFPRAQQRQQERAGSFNVVKGRKNVVARLLEMVQRAEEDIVVTGSAALAVRLLFHLPDLEQAKARGVQVRILCPVTDTNGAAVERLRLVAEVRPSAQSSQGSGTAIVDGRESLMCHFVPDDEHLFKGDDVGIWSDDKAIVSDQLRTLLAQWEQAQA